MAGIHGKAKPFTSWPGSKKQRKGIEFHSYLWGHTAYDLRTSHLSKILSLFGSTT
jgi:hypothetical protein